MVASVAKALVQIWSAPLRSILWRAVGLALALVVVGAVLMHRFLVWFATGGEVWAQSMLGSAMQTPLDVALWIVSIAAGFGLLLGSIFLMPAVTSFVAGFFVDDIADIVERDSYPGDAPGRPLPLPLALAGSVKTALLAVLVYLCALPFLLLAGVGAVLFFFATAYLLSREYFELAASRHRPLAEAKRLRRAHAGIVFAAGLPIALFVSIPILNLATPLFGTVTMVHLHKALTRRAGRTAMRAEPRHPRTETSP